MADAGDTAARPGPRDSGSADGGADTGNREDELDSAASLDSDQGEGAVEARTPNLFTGGPRSAVESGWLYDPALAGCSVEIGVSSTPYTRVMEFDGRGRATRDAQYDAEAELYSEALMEWNDVDCMVRLTSSALGASQTTTAKCDDFGNPLEQRRVSYDTWGHQESTSRFSYEYDENNLVLSARSQHDDETPWLSTLAWVDGWISEWLMQPETPSRALEGVRYVGTHRSDGQVIESHSQACQEGGSEQCYDSGVAIHQYGDDGSVLQVERTSISLSATRNGPVTQVETAHARWLTTYGDDLRRPLRVDLVEGAWAGADWMTFNLDCP